MKDYYNILGVDRAASAEDIKQAYRRAAARHHPDRGGDTAVFQQIEEAYRILSDPAQRSQYDNPHPFQQGGQGFPGGFHFNFTHGGQDFDFDSIFNMFGAQFRRPPQQARMVLTISLRDAVEGATKTVRVATESGSNDVELKIPPGIDDGQQVQYGGIAPGGIDLIVQYRVQPDPVWQRQGLDLHAEYRISIWDLIRGTKIRMTTISGTAMDLDIPPRTQPNMMMRAQGFGVPDRNGNRGAAYVKLIARIPNTISADLLAAIGRE